MATSDTAIKEVTTIVIGNNVYTLTDGINKVAIKELSNKIEALDVNTGTTDSTVSKVITGISQTNGLIAYHSSDVKTTIDNTNTIPTSAAVKTYVDDIAKSIIPLNFTVVKTLPTASSSTTKSIYLVPHTTNTSGEVEDVFEDENSYDEYITVTENTSSTLTYKWEKIGSTDVSLTGLVTGVSASFTGYIQNHSHNWTQSDGYATYDKTSKVSSSYTSTNSTKTISATYTPAGTITHSVTGTTGTFVNSVTSSSNSKDVLTAGTLTDSYSNGILTLSFTPTTSSMSYVTSVTSKTADAVTSVNAGTATFTGNASTITMTLPDISNDITYSSTKAAATVTGNISTESLTPAGRINITTTKHD